MTREDIEGLVVLGVLAIAAFKLVMWVVGMLGPTPKQQPILHITPSSTKLLGMFAAFVAQAEADARSQVEREKQTKDSV